MRDKIIQKQLDFLGSAYDTVVKSVGELRFDAESPAHVLAIALHGTVIELTAACISMLNNGNSIAVPILLRSMTEALVDQTNLLTDAEYAKNMHAGNLKETEKLLVQAGDQNNALLSSLRRTIYVPTGLQELRAELEALRKAGRGDLKVFEKFRRAGMEAEYRSVYALLCLESHGNTSALVERHVEIRNGQLELSIFKEARVNSIRTRIDAITAMLLQSADMAHDAFKSGCTAIKPLLEAHRKLWQELFPTKEETASGNPDVQASKSSASGSA